MKTADALIIGGGVIGASIAYHLAKKGFKKITVVDSGQFGSGSTGKATGGFRAQFGSEINVKLSLLSRKKLIAFNDETGSDPEFMQFGYLFLAQSDDELKRLRKANDIQKSAGLNEAEIVDLRTIEKLNPHVNLNGVTGGAFCKSDGFISPLQILKGYTDTAKKLCIEFLYETEVTCISSTGGKINSVKTNTGEFQADVLINAAGAWAGRLAQLAGVDLPVRPLKRQVCCIAESNILPSDLPMTIWIDNSFHFRMRNGKLILLMPSEPESREEFNAEVEDSWLGKVFEAAKTRIPALSNCSIDRLNSWAGLYEMSPDEHLILGKAPGFDNFYFANGSSGHGVMHSPAIGQLLAELISGEETAFDITSLSPNRFDKNKLIMSVPFF